VAVAPTRPHPPIPDEAIAAPVTHAEQSPWPRRIGWSVVLVAVGAIGLLWLTPGFPERWVVDVTGRFDAFRDWAIQNRTTSWLFVYLITPIEKTITVVFDATVNVLERVTWLGLVVGASGLAGLVAGWRMALLTAAGVLSFGLLGVHGRVPLVDDLDGVGAEPALTLRRPVVGRVGEVVAKQPDGHLVAAQRRPPQPPHRAQVGAPLIDHLRRPRPRVRRGVGGERPHRPLAALHGPGREVAGQLLAAPAVQHRGKHLLLGPQQRQAGDHVQPGHARGEPLVLHRR